jgi:ATP-dependent Clp protease ATP-binding subunit ClpA
VEAIASADLAAARRKFTPEFINRLDKIVVFKLLRKRARRIRPELNQCAARIHQRAGTPPLFVRQCQRVARVAKARP